MLKTGREENEVTGKTERSALGNCKKMASKWFFKFRKQFECRPTWDGTKFSILSKKSCPILRILIVAKNLRLPRNWAFQDALRAYYFSQISPPRAASTAWQKQPLENKVFVSLGFSRPGAPYSCCMSCSFSFSQALSFIAPSTNLESPTSWNGVCQVLWKAPQIVMWTVVWIMAWRVAWIRREKIHAETLVSTAEKPAFSPNLLHRFLLFCANPRLIHCASQCAWHKW